MQQCIFKKHNFDVKFFDVLYLTQQKTTVNDIAQALSTANTHAASKLRILVKAGFVDRLTVGVAGHAAIYCISEKGILLLEDLCSNFIINKLKYLSTII